MTSQPRWLTALPVFNEVDYVEDVLREVAMHSQEILVVDDGSTDGTAERLRQIRDIHVITHFQNQGYGAALMTAFEFAKRRKYEGIVTIDCDGQHEPQRIPRFVSSCADADIVSGSRYLKRYPGDSAPPAQRRDINLQVTERLNTQLGLALTDAFCGFKAYRVSALDRLNLTEMGYAMPLELWVEAAVARLKVIELPVPLIYLDDSRSFGGSLDDGSTRLDYYHQVIDRSLVAANLSVTGKTQLLCGEGTK